MQDKSLILAVDDERNVTTLLRSALVQAGYEVITANDGNQVLDLVAQKKPDLVLLDIRMPGKTGVEILQELRASYPDIAAIMVTAVTDTNVAIKALTDGAYGYLNKPFNVNELILIVERALERRSLLLKNREYQFNLERKFSEQTQTLQQRIRELTALNNLFTKYLNQGFEAADKYFRLASEIVTTSEDIKSVAKQGSEETRIMMNSLSSHLVELAEEIQVLAIEAQAMRVGVQAAPGQKKDQI